MPAKNTTALAIQIVTDAPVRAAMNPETIGGGARATYMLVGNRY